MNFLFEVNEEMEAYLLENLKEGTFGKTWIPAQEVYVIDLNTNRDSWRIQESQAAYSSFPIGFLPRVFQQNPLYYSKDLCLDVKESQVTCGNTVISLSPSECVLMETFMQNTHSVLTREVLCACIERVSVHSIQDNTLTTRIRRLRKKLSCQNKEKALDEYIETVRSIGYRWSGDVVMKYK